MKKLSLNAAPFSGEVLTRNQLRNVLGGDGSGTGGVCDDWRSKPAVCYNCCITVHSIEYCGEECPYT